MADTHDIAAALRWALEVLAYDGGARDEQVIAVLGPLADSFAQEGVLGWDPAAGVMVQMEQTFKGQSQISYGCESWRFPAVSAQEEP